VRRGFLGGGLEAPKGMEERYRQGFTAMQNMVRELYTHGVQIVAGTDSLAGFAYHRELELYVAAGIPAPAVLRIATLDAARVMKSDRELGSIETGKLADLVLVEGDPTVRIGDVRNVRLVVKNGVLFDPAAIDRAIGVKP
jgi:imidazolonepropionase-like amidohydrolase